MVEKSPFLMKVNTFGDTTQFDFKLLAESYEPLKK